MKFIIKTLGCKVNQVESAYIFERLKEHGFQPVKREEEAEIFIINSCAVTESAFKEAKKILKGISKYHPKVVIFTGCSAKIYVEEIKALASSLKIPHFLILGQKEKFEPEKFLEILENLPPIFEKIESDLNYCYPILLKEFHGHSRAFVKIQDGCSSFCSYCIVPYTRGPSRSLPEEHILKQIEIYLTQGYTEIVLTGIHLGMWGEDLKPKKKLTDLLFKIEEFLEKWERPLHLGLSSLEVNEIDEDFLSFVKGSAFLCPHFHLPLQSGSNEILRKMNRKYTKEEYLEKLNLLYQISPEATFGADVLCGFPGEDDKAFLETCEVIEKSPLNWLHVFPFSPRPGTPAEKMDNQVPKEKIKERVHHLLEIHKKKRKAFILKNLGSIRTAVIEKIEEKKIYGLTNNYISVVLTAENLEISPKKIVKVKLKELYGDLVFGEILKF